MELKAIQDEIESSRMPLWQHLEELRTTLFRCLAILAIGLCFTWNYSESIIHFLEKPLLDLLPIADKHLYFTGITEKFFIYFKISTYAALALTSPLLVREFWLFLSPALYKNEKKFLLPFLFIGTFAFALGMAFAYKIVIPYGYQFLIQFGSPSDKAMITLNEYFSLTTQLLLAMGFVFEMPVALMLLAKFGMIKSSWISKFRGHAYVVLAIVAGIITPTPDAFTLILVLVPLCLLYEVSAVLVKWVTSEDKKMEQAI